MQIKRLDHLVLRVANTARSCDFYQQLLGCSVEREVAEIGLVQLRAGDSLIDLVPIAQEDDEAHNEAASVAGEPNMAHFCLLMEPFDLRLIQARCAALGVACEAPKRRYGATGYGPSVYLTDPDGNLLELKGRGGLDQR